MPDTKDAAVSKSQRLLLSHGGSCLAWGLKSMNSRVELSWINWLYDLGKMPNLPGQQFLHLKCRGNWENSGGCCSVTQSCPTLFNPMNCSTSLSFIISQSLLKLMSVESLMPSNHLALFCPLLFLLSIFPASGSFLMNQFSSSGQTIGTSASASVLPMNIQDLFPLGLTGLISLQPKGL